MPEQRPSYHFDHHTQEFARDPWSVYAELRARCPVAYSDAYGGFWVLSRYADVFEVARDDETFSSNREVVVPPTNVGKLIPLQSDPPALGLYRRLLMPYFSPRAVEALEPEIRAFTTRQIDTFIERGTCDLVLELTNPVPAMTTLRLIGLPLEEWHDYAEPIHTNSYTHPDNPLHGEALLRIQELGERVAAQIQARRTQPRDDLISDLLRAEAQGEIGPEEVQALVMMVIFGGMDTTMASTSNALLYLYRHPEARQELIRRPELLPTAIDELLRYEAPVQGFARTVTRDCVVGGQPIKAGETVFMLWASANRDGAAFPQPDRVILDRFPNRHMTFGIGAHRCLGAGLARSEMRIMLEEVLRRLPDYQILEEGVEEPESIGIVKGRVRLPVRFTPGRRLS
jgi:cytochrome P450